MRLILASRQACQARLPTCSRRVQLLRCNSVFRQSRGCTLAAAASSSTPAQQQQLLRSEQQPPQQQDDSKQTKTRMPLDSFMRPSSSKSSKGGSEEPPSPPPGPNLPPQLRQLLALLTEFGGKLGTAAVLIAWFTHIDPFGNFHWDQAQVQFGLMTFLPLMVFDAALMLPDYSISDVDEQRAVTGMFVGPPELLSAPPKASSSSSSSSDIEAAGSSNGVTSSTQEDSSSSSSSSSSSDSSRKAVSDAEARRMADIIEKAAAGASPDAPVVIMQQQPQLAASSGGSSSSSSSSGSSKGELSPLLRLRVSMGLLQQVYTRANPGIGLSPVAEFVVVLVATLADEMLYRAVALTLLGLWLRDRLFEAGFDDDVTVNWLTSATGQPLQMPIGAYSEYLAVAVVAGLGVAGFTLGALREIQKLQKMQVLDRDGNSDTPAAQALKAQLVSNLGSQNVSLYAVEGLREVTASVMAGMAFVTTHNLAAPMAGSVVVQTLFSLYQRISLARARSKRQALKEKVMQRQAKLEAAMQAALAAKKAEEAKAAAAAAEAAAAAAAEAAEASSSTEAEQEEEEVDFLTAVLRAAEQQQKQQQAAAAASSSSSNGTSIADSTPANWHAGPSEAADSSGSSSSSSNGSSGAAAAAAAAAAASPEVAQQQLATLLEDMLRSPEGNKVVQAWLARQDSETRDSFASSSDSSSPQEAIEKLLADPATKAALIGELQEQLVGMSESATKRQQQLEKSWRSKL